jgi:hypothetical protein
MPLRKLKIHDHPLIKKCVTDTPRVPNKGGIRNPGRNRTIKKVNTRSTQTEYSFSEMDLIKLN